MRSGQPGINGNEYASLPIPLPKSLPEQQKIASCLSSLDDLITAENQKLEALKAHKKGLMQQLFPVNGQITPILRFAEFRRSGEWEEKKLGDVCSNIASGKDKTDENGEYDLYGSTGVIGKSNTCSYQGDFILIARVGANAGLLTRSKGKFGVTDNTLVLSLDKSQNIDFIYYSLENVGLNKLVFGSGQPLITGGQLKNLDIYFPSSDEQQKIASCLSSLDELIAAQAEKIEALKEHKKGLMQGLFPSEL
jgi:type I restriction enzyme S subunit